MIRILHTYISRELAKVSVLALVAFTLVMTVFAIIEPLREQGLTGQEVAALFAYTLPVMLSLTLPIGALFAATIVYGRFSQDNELLACRASGISTLSLLKPGIVLAMIVTSASLALSNLVAPVMAERAGRAIKANVRNIAYSQLKSRKYIEYKSGENERFVIHADDVDPAKNVLYGVVGIHITSSERRMGAAASTKVAFFESEGENYVAFGALHLSGGAIDKNNYDYLWESRQVFPAIKIPNPVKEKASWYEWGRLRRTIEHPELDARISQELSKVRREIAHYLFCNEVADSISDKPARGFHFLSDRRPYMLLADKAHVTGKETVSLSSARGSPVVVTSMASEPEAAAYRACACLLVRFGLVASSRAVNMLARHAMPGIRFADAGRIEADYDRAYEKSVATIRLDRPVFEVMFAQGRVGRIGGWSTQFEVPERFINTVGRVTLDNAQEKALQLGSHPAILNRIKKLNDSDIPSLKGKLIGEMHGRLAYGVNCFLLVAIGGALGLIFRGGHVLSAFTTSAVPAAAAIVLSIMGKELARNSQIPLIAGLAVIWAGVAALAVACLFVYLYLYRK